MAVIKAFKGIRPRKDIVSKVAALPYDVLSSEEGRASCIGNPYSFLHIDKAEIDLEENIDIHSKKVYEKARDNLIAMIKKGELNKDKEDYLYIYEEIMEGRSQKGLVFLSSVDDYINNIIKKHEFTRESKEIDRTNHIDYCNANTGPIFLTYREDKNINSVVEKIMRDEKEYSFESEDGVIQNVWVIKEKFLINKLIDLFKNINSLYIADGHHRCASAVNVCKIRRKENKNFTGEEEFNYFLAVAFPHNDLRIMPYNRVVKDLNGLSKEEFLNKVRKNFYVEKKKESVKPKEKHDFGMFLEGEWYLLRAKEGIFNKDDIIDSLDVSILQKNILEDILKIYDVRTSERIDFVGGIRGIKELERRVNTDMKIAFSLYETDIEDIMKVSDLGKIMPPKSTWFEPKLRSGIFIHEI